MPAIVRGETLTEGLLLVVNSAEDTITFLSPSEPGDAHKLTTRKHPQDIVVSPDKTLAYVAEMGSETGPGNSIAVIDLRAREIVRRFALGRATRPHLLALSHDGKILWAACAPQNSIVEVDVRDGMLRTQWDTQQKGSYMFAVTPDESKQAVRCQLRCRNRQRDPKVGRFRQGPSAWRATHRDRCFAQRAGSMGHKFPEKQYCDR